MNIYKFRSKQTVLQPISGRVDPDQTQRSSLGPSPFAIVSAHFEPYLYMLKHSKFSGQIAQLGERQTLDHLRGEVLCL